MYKVHLPVFGRCPNINIISEREKKGKDNQWDRNYIPGIYIYTRSFFYLLNHFFFPAQLVRTKLDVYPQRSSGQSVVAGVVPSPPRYVPSFLSRIGFSIPTARRFSSDVVYTLGPSATQFLRKRCTTSTGRKRTHRNSYYVTMVVCLETGRFRAVSDFGTSTPTPRKVHHRVGEKCGNFAPD